MNSWIDLLIDKKSISSIFTTNEPSLAGIDLHDIVFHRDGPKITLRFNIVDYPPAPPKKWVIQKYNTVQLQLTAIDIDEVKLSGWKKSNYVLDLNISRENGFVIISAQDDVFYLYVKSAFLDISSITAYTLSK